MASRKPLRSARPYPLDVPALRDALGLARLRYAVESTDGADPARLLAIAEAGRLLKLAIEQATKFEPMSMARRAAPENARQGFEKLSKVAGAEVGLLVETAKRRVLTSCRARAGGVGGLVASVDGCEHEQ